ncbi:MAG: glycosyltransferase family 4 protein [Chloroflexota bacterium]|nr:MAG: glycosyltransferase family 4 protein [Chloroflexota bacterium]
MRIVLIVPEYTIGMQRKVEYLCAEGCEVRQVVSMRTHSILTAPASDRRFANHALVPVRVLRRQDPHRSMLASTLHWMRAFSPDVLAVEWDPDTLMALQALIVRRMWAPRAKLVLHSWQNIPRALSRRVRFILSRTLRAADCILCANREGVSVLRGWGYRGRIVHQPWIGVDTALFYPRERAALRDKLRLRGFLVGYVGRLVPEKGLDQLILALAQLPEDVHCVLVGGGNERDRLKGLAATRGLTSRVHFVGEIDHDSMPEYLSMFDTLVLPSRTTAVWKEQFGRVLIEGMACRVPIVGSDSGAIPEVIGSAGLTFREGDINNLAERLHALYRSPELCGELAQRGLEQATTTYSQAHIGARLARVYRGLAFVQPDEECCMDASSPGNQP